MKVDVVFPKGNEAQLVSMATCLGFEGLVMVYPEGKQKAFKAGFKIKLCVLIDPKRYSKRAPKAQLTFVEGGMRHEFEKLCPSVIYNLEYSQKRDKTHFRLSGLDDVLCRLARENDILVGYGVGKLLKSYQRDVVLGRIMQNIRFCRKFNVGMVLASFASEPYQMRSPHDIKALGISLGMTPVEAIRSVCAFDKCFNG
jgi:hypothetical protein